MSRFQCGPQVLTVTGSVARRPCAVHLLRKYRCCSAGWLKICMDSLHRGSAPFGPPAARRSQRQVGRSANWFSAGEEEKKKKTICLWRRSKEQLRRLLCLWLSPAAADKSLMLKSPGCWQCLCCGAHEQAGWPAFPSHFSCHQDADGGIWRPVWQFCGAIF